MNPILTVIFISRKLHSMCSRSYFVSILILFAKIIFISTLLHAGPIEVLSDIEWEQHFGDKKYSYQNKSLTFSPDGKELIVGGMYSTGRRQSDIEGVWVWKINDKGTRIADIKLENKKDLNLVDIEALESLDNKNILLVGRLDTGQSVLIKLDAQGKVLLSRGIGNGRHISKIIRTSDGKFLLIGHEFTNGFLIKIDAAGAEQWSRVVDRGKDDFFVDGVATDDNGFLLIENSGKLEQFFM